MTSFRDYLGCRHWRQEVPVGRYMVTCSGLSSVRGDSIASPYPDYGIYLAAQWRDALGDIWTNGAAIGSVAKERPYPALVIAWADMSGLPPYKLNQLVEICRSKLRQGKVIDIGCLQAHGRTGTLLAALIARVEHLTAPEAIAVVHQRYCRHAVETAGQRQAVEAYVRQYGIKRR